MAQEFDNFINLNKPNELMATIFGLSGGLHHWNTVIKCVLLCASCFPMNSTYFLS